MLCFASQSVMFRPISSRKWSCSFFRAMQRVIDGWTRLQSNVWITSLETASLVSRSLICFLLLRSAILLTAAVGAHCMSPSDDDRYAPSGHRPTNQNTPSPECRASEMQYESRAVSLFALRSLSRPRYSQLAARGSRLEYRTRFLAAPPAGILEQKRDCSQSTLSAAYMDSCC